MKLWAVVDKVETELNTAEEQYKDEMSEEQGQFAENLNFISNHVNRLSGYTDMGKVFRFHASSGYIQRYPLARLVPCNTMQLSGISAIADGAL